MPATVFLLGPARCGGPRAAQLAASEASALGVQLRARGAPIGDVFAWLSALYFRGKLTYARAFGRGLVMAPGRGLVPPERTITARELAAMGEIDLDSAKFTRPLGRDAARLRGRVVLLGSGGQMLRASHASEELAYVPVDGAIRRGTRPAKLPRLPR